ncbi:Phosphate-import permease protein PhnE [Thalassovita gelatinovora]|uniref:Phosphate-import permease protein PhnE n=1 Tax=Thalassovita gelatinovora TaxID=53501 RepID=A0A0P1F9B3_THAGE|nr:phosphonate ABC transporter, permease protein PhnE [Thalassovita gelatinovora]QIZ81165.1 phosphonate ABC transporter, permease protein PhnE [Thalassovita gelatinovora]CUH64784.1 Phosphate-import permease protein PhnE [Thalassovita gelatinovora]SEP92065.1 phosphonate transport system permease protein [Thalassovita gelatinovora]
MTAIADIPAQSDWKDTATARITRKRLIAFSAPLVILTYFVYLFFAFDISGLAGRARMDNAAVLVADSYSYKTHVTHDNRRGDLSIAIEGENKGTYPDGMTPDFVTLTGESTARIALTAGESAKIDGATLRYSVPGYGTVTVTVEGRKISLVTPDDTVPDWISSSSSRVTITGKGGRASVTRARTEVFRYSYGWELFWFTLDSPFYGKSPVELLGLALSGDRVVADKSNFAAMVDGVWNNAMWRHKDVLWAIFETILMAFLGTMGAAIIALPLAFLAARNFSPFIAVRFGFRRLFDFVRGVDGLIWTIILSRAFGPGPLTGALAILLTDTGSFGKMFSEALENVDDKQIEGIQSTGAKPLQRYRFGVIPQITPVLLSQVLYYLESNTRSATIIGAITGGGIGLLLTQAIITQKDWEEVSYYIVLIILMVMLMDWISGMLRRKLIKG